MEKNPPKNYRLLLRCHREDFQLYSDAPSNAAEGDRLRLPGSRGEAERRGERWREEEEEGGGGRSGWIWSKRSGALAKRSESGAFVVRQTLHFLVQKVFLKMEMESFLDIHVILDLTAASCVDLQEASSP